MRRLNSYAHIKPLLFVLMSLFACFWSCSKGKDGADGISTPTQRLEIVSDEVSRFYEIIEGAAEKKKQALLSHFKDSAQNPAIHTIYQKTLKPRGDDGIWDRFVKFEKYLKSMKPYGLAMAKKDYTKIGEYYSEFKKIYPQVHSPKILFTTGLLTVGGTVTKEGLVISTEFYAKGKENIDTAGLSIPTFAILDESDFAGLTFHEHMHYEQIQLNPAAFENSKRSSLLSAVLLEGAADFTSNLVTHWNDNRPNYVYGKEHEKALWEKLQADIEKSPPPVNEWMYNTAIAKEPGLVDIGYFIGAQICKSYYENAKDKAQAIEDILILSIKDPAGFLEKSKYAEKFR